MSKINGQARKINTGECKIVTIGVFGCMVGRVACVGRWRDGVFVVERENCSKPLVMIVFVCVYFFTACSLCHF